MMATMITKHNFQSEVLEAKGPVLLDFFANWCAPCRMLTPIIEEIAQEQPDVKVCKINVDEEAELAAGFQVMSIPMLVVMKDGKAVQKSVGVQPKEQIIQMLKA